AREGTAGRNRPAKSMNPTLALILAFVLCSGLSFLMSGMESGVFALSPLRIRQLKRKGNARATTLLRFLENPENFLLTILIGNTVANFTIFALAAMTLHDWMPGRPWTAVLLFFVLVFLFYTILELLPKTIFRLFPNRLALVLAGPFRLVHFILAPVVTIVSWLARALSRSTGGKEFSGQLFGNREEFRLVIQESSHGLSSEEKVMINRVLDLQTMTLRHLIIPLTHATLVAQEAKMSDILALAREKKFTRYPVFQKEGARVRIIGIVSLKRLLYSEDLNLNKSAGEYIRPALFLNENLRLEDALRRMQRGGQRLAVVLDAHQREIGIVSLQDILKMIFGEVSL
ncbi:MAG: hypothetical protein JWM68_2581, partial [Verrucomicrobiales bacterium]|nr:hypothetical protein [Verrucomicrobiales bacterium]